MSDEYGNDFLLNAIHSNETPIINKVIAELSKEELNLRGKGGQTPLMFAVLAGKEKTVLPLLEAGADHSLGEKSGYTPIHGAAYQGRASVTKLLIDFGVPFQGDEGKHEDGFWPMHRACWGGEQRHTDTVKVFLEAGVERDLRAENGRSCMDMALENPMTVRLLRNFRRQRSEASMAAKSKSQLKMEQIKAKRAANTAAAANTATSATSATAASTAKADL